jgi:hypothetical protein
MIEIGMTETQVGSILREEFAALGMPDGEGLVLFGGEWDHHSISV